MKEFTIKLWVKILAWLSAAIIVYLNIHLVIDEVTGWLNTAGNNKTIIYSIVIPIIVACFALLAYVFIHPFLSKAEKIPQLPHGQAENFISGPAINITTSELQLILRE